MIITIDPDYNLFVRILFMIWVLWGIIEIIAGFSQKEKPQHNKYGIIEIVHGIIMLMVVVVVVT